MSQQLQASIANDFLAFIQGFEIYFDSAATRKHFHNYCQSILSDLPRKSAAAIAEPFGKPPRSIQQFLQLGRWDHVGLLQALNNQLLAAMNEREIGTIAFLSESSVPKRGIKTPGVARQYLGCKGRPHNGIVMVNLAAVQEGIGAHLDTELFVPDEWNHDRDRCSDADIPDRDHRSKSQLALDLLDHAEAQGWRFDAVVFDQAHGRDLNLSRDLEAAGRKFIGATSSAFQYKPWGNAAIRTAISATLSSTVELFELSHPAPMTLEVYAARIIFDGESANSSSGIRLLRVLDGFYGKTQYLLTNLHDRCELHHSLQAWIASITPCERLNDRTSEQAIRHFEGRSYIAWKRHVTLCLVASAFEAAHEVERRECSESAMSVANAS